MTDETQQKGRAEDKKLTLEERAWDIELFPGTLDEYKTIKECPFKIMDVNRVYSPDQLYYSGLQRKPCF